MGNSEVGHLNLGAGRVVMQTIQRITAAIESGEFFENEPLVRPRWSGCASAGGTLHFMGLIGPGGVHAVDAHLLALCELAPAAQAARASASTPSSTGATPRRSPRADFLTELVGRAQPRATAARSPPSWAATGRWTATSAGSGPDKAYDALVYGEGEPIRDPVAGRRARRTTPARRDEFIKPRVVVDERASRSGSLRDGDGIVFFNFRADRARQLSRALASRGVRRLRPRRPPRRTWRWSP